MKAALLTKPGRKPVKARAVNAVAGKKLTATPAPLPPDGVSESLARILRPQAAYRWLLPQLAAITPQYIESTLRGALAGNHVQAWELFDLMEDTWHRLSKNCNELKSAVKGMHLVFDPYQEEDEEPTNSAKEKNSLVSAAVRQMRPSAAADENNLSGTIYDILDAWFKGVSVCEIDWYFTAAGKAGNILAPRSTYWVHPICYAWGMDGRLGLRTDAQGRLDPANISSMTYQPLPSSVRPFPESKFIIAVRKAKSGTALGGALLRPLAWWWCAANFSADWLLNLAQVFGLPFRWANYAPNAPQATIDAICKMLQNMGSAGWAAFPAGTTMEMKEAGRSGEHSPQGDVLKMADMACDLLVLGQTLTTQMHGSGGSFAAAKVHEGVKGEIIESAASFVCDVLKESMFRPILMLNYGEDSECPEVGLESEKEEDLVAKSTIVSTLGTAGAGEIIGLDWLGKTFDIPKPEAGERTLGSVAQEAAAAAQKQASTPAAAADDIDSGATSAREGSLGILKRIQAVGDDALFVEALKAYSQHAEAA